MLSFFTCLQYSAFFPGLFVAFNLSHFLLVLFLKLTVGVCVYMSMWVISCVSDVICIRVLESFHMWFCVHIVYVCTCGSSGQCQSSPVFLSPSCSGMRSLKLEPFQSSKLLKSELHGFRRCLPAVRVVDWRDKPGSPASTTGTLPAELPL